VLAVREGLLQEDCAGGVLAQGNRTGLQRRSAPVARGQRAVLRGGFGYEQQHSEHVRELSIQLFDQLQPVHHMPAQSRVLLEAGRASCMIPDT